MNHQYYQLTAIFIKYLITKSNRKQILKMINQQIAKQILMIYKQKYTQFKQQLLTMMIDKDPLAILQSGIFQRFEQVFEPNCTKLKNNTPINFNKSKQIGIERCEEYKFATKISQEQFQGISFELVERRSFSCSKYSISNVQKQNIRIKQLQEQNKIDFCVWSNILNNNFIPKSQYNHQKAKVAYLQKQLDQYHNNDKQNNSYLANISSISNQNIEKCKQNVPIKNYEQNNPFDLALKQCLKNCTSQNVKRVINQLKQKIQKQYSFNLWKLNEIIKENKQLHKTIAAHSLKELQFIIKEKDSTMLVEKLRKQLNDLKINTQNKIRQNCQEMQKKGRFSQQQYKKNVIEQLKEKLMIDNLRRNTLLGLDREKIEFQLKKEQMAIQSQNYYSTQKQQL